jgi:long-chain acyl-CoA synthetase
VYLTGRAKDIIKRGGANVAPAEVEAALLHHAAVQSVAVVGVPDEFYGEVPIAYVVKRANFGVSSGELIEFASSRLAKFKVPAHILFIRELPLGKTGKVDKNQLKGDWTQLHSGQQSPRAPDGRRAENR